MAVEQRGRGLPILFIHGYPLTNAMWQPQIEEFADLAMVIAPDLRCHGESLCEIDSDLGHYPLTMELFADDCMFLLDYLGINQPVVLCGLSMGGYVSFAFYKKFPERVAGLVLVATKAGPDTSETRSSRASAIQQVREYGIGSVADSMPAKLLSPNTIETRPEIVTQVREIILRNSPYAIIGDQLGMMKREDSTNVLSNIRVPTLILAGEDDVIIPRKETLEMHSAISGARLVILPEAGHLQNLEQSTQFNIELKDFIGAIRS